MSVPMETSTGITRTKMWSIRGNMQSRIMLLAWERAEGVFSPSNVVSLNDPSNPDAGSEWGIYGYNSKTTFSEIRDGSSNVIAFGERWSKSEEQAGGNADVKAYGAVWSGDPGAERFGINDGSQARNSTSAILGSVGRTSPGSAISFGINGTRASELLASSFHAGGAMVVYGDGSSHFLSEDIDFEIFGHMAQMGDGNVTSQ